MNLNNNTFVRAATHRPGFAGIGRLSNFTTWVQQLCLKAGIDVARFDIKAFDAFIDAQRESENTYYDLSGKLVGKNDPAARFQYFRTNLLAAGEAGKEIWAKFVYNPSIRPPLPPWDGVEFVLNAPSPFILPSPILPSPSQKKVAVSKADIVDSAREFLSGCDWKPLAGVGVELERKFPGFTYEGTGYAKLSDLLMSTGDFEMVRDANNLPSIRLREVSSASANLTSVKLREMTSVPGSLHWEQSEVDFLASFQRFVESSGFKYDPRDLVRFHTAVKCEKMTILGGVPGTGKSSLSELYVRALRGRRFAFWNDEELTGNYLTVDVSPSWTEPSDLLGYFNIKHEFQPAENGFYKFMRAAMDEPDLRFVCFEEMNLAIVEHYFATFMQVLSKRMDIPSTLHGCRCANENSDLEVRSSVRFIGTCNADETTQSLSPRFLDRCHFIELTPTMSFDGFVEAYSKGCHVEDECRRLDEEISEDRYASWVLADNRLSQNVLEKLHLLYDGFKRVGLTMSPRSLTAIIKYISNRPPFQDEVSSFDALQMRALDEAVVQRVLSHYRPKPFGGETQKDDLLKLLDEFPFSTRFVRYRYDDKQEHPIPT